MAPLSDWLSVNKEIDFWDIDEGLWWNGRIKSVVDDLVDVFFIGSHGEQWISVSIYLFNV